MNAFAFVVEYGVDACLGSFQMVKFGKHIRQLFRCLPPAPPLPPSHLLTRPYSGEAAQHCVDYKRCKQIIKMITGPSAPPLLRLRTLDGAGAIVAVFWGGLGEDLRRVGEYHRWKG